MTPLPLGEPDLSRLGGFVPEAKEIAVRLFSGQCVFLRGTYYALNESFELCSVQADTVHLAPHARILIRLARPSMSLQEFAVWCAAAAQE
jgi:hypothetical protein